MTDDTDDFFLSFKPATEQGSTSHPGIVEVAAADAQLLTSEEIAAIDFIHLTHFRLDTLRGFVAKMPDAQKGNVVNAEGQLNPQEAELRLKTALVYRALEDDFLASQVRIAKREDGAEVNKLLDALVLSAPTLLQCLSGFEAGRRMRLRLAEGATLAIRILRKGMNLDELMGQPNIFETENNDLLHRTQLMLFAAEGRTVTTIAQTLKSVAQDFARLNNPGATKRNRTTRPSRTKNSASSKATPSRQKLSARSADYQFIWTNAGEKAMALLFSGADEAA